MKENQKRVYKPALALILIAAVCISFLTIGKIIDENKNTGNAAQETINKKSSFTSLLQAPAGCCANLNTYFCADGIQPELCCPASGYPPGEGVPDSNTDCMSYYFSSYSSCSEFGMCLTGCCLDTNTGECSDIPESQCLNQGHNFNSVECWTEVETGTFVQNVEGCTNPPGEIIDCYAREDYNDCAAPCFWCPEVEGQCVPFCDSTTCLSNPNNPLTGNTCSGVTINGCNDGIDNDSPPDGFQDGNDICCYNPDSQGETKTTSIVPCYCPTANKMLYSDAQCNPGNLYSETKYNKGSELGCCKSESYKPKICTPNQQISSLANNGYDLTGDVNLGMCLCGAVNVSITDTRYCCDNIIQTQSCQNYIVTGNVKFYNAIGGQTITDIVDLFNIGHPTFTVYKDATIYPAQVQFYDITNGNYQFSLPAGTYTIQVAQITYQDLIYGSNSTTFTVANADVSGRDMTLIHSEAIQPPEVCTDYTAPPDLTIKRIPCEDKANLTWTYACPEIIQDGTSFTLIIYDGTSSIFRGLEMSDVNVISPGKYNLVVDDLEPSINYNFTIQVNAEFDEQAVTNPSDTTNITIGDSFCIDRTQVQCDIDFCIGSQTFSCSELGWQNFKYLKRECAGGCINLGDNAVCLDSSDCKNINTQPFILNSYNPNIFGLYYYDYKPQCYNNYNPLTLVVDANLPKYCYYDTYSKADEDLDENPVPDTTTDVCLSCNLVKDCPDYNSKEACLTDHCQLGNKRETTCNWISTPGTFEELGKGYCYYAGYTGTEFCDRCGTDDAFKSSGCGENVCGALGNCIPNAAETSCSNCDIFIQGQTTDATELSTCYEYEDQAACTADSCKLGMCKWILGKCAKDGNDDNIDDCIGSLETDSCKRDYVRPYTILGSPGYINYKGTLFNFTSTDLYPVGTVSDKVAVYYCFSANEGGCASIPLDAQHLVGKANPLIIKFNESTDPSLFNKEGEAYLHYITIDKHNNTGEKLTQQVHVDTKVPQIGYSNQIIPRPESNSDIKFTITASSERVFCKYKFSQNDSVSGILEQGQTAEITYYNYGDGQRLFTYNCTDNHQNSKIENYIINVQRNYFITNERPTLSTTDPKPIYPKPTDQRTIRFSFDIASATPLQLACTYNDLKQNGKSGSFQTENSYYYWVDTILKDYNIGEHIINVTCKTTQGQYLDGTMLYFWVDNTAPTTAFKIGGVPITATNVLAIPGQEVELECTGESFLLDPVLEDDKSHIDYCTNTADCTPNAQYLGPYTLEHSTHYCYRCYDLAGNAETTKCKTITVDESNPIIIVVPDATIFQAAETAYFTSATITDPESPATQLRIFVKNETSTARLEKTYTNSGSASPWTVSNIDVNLFTGKNTISFLANNTLGRTGVKIITAYYDIFGPEFTRTPRIVGVSLLTNVSYNKDMTFNISLNDTRYTALRSEGQNNGVNITIISEEGAVMQEESFECGAANICLATLAANPDLVVGNYNATFQPYDDFGNVNNNILPLQFSIKDEGRPNVTITALKNQAEVTRVSAGHEDLIQDLFIARINLTENAINSRIELQLNPPLEYWLVPPAGCTIEIPTGFYFEQCSDSNPKISRFDVNLDGLVDKADIAIVQGCVLQPASNPDCAIANFDCDTHISEADAGYAIEASRGYSGVYECNLILSDSEYSTLNGVDFKFAINSLSRNSNPVKITKGEILTIDSVGPLQPPIWLPNEKRYTESTKYNLTGYAQKDNGITPSYVKIFNTNDGVEELEAVLQTIAWNPINYTFTYNANNMQVLDENTIKLIAPSLPSLPIDEDNYLAFAIDADNPKDGTYYNITEITTSQPSADIIEYTITFTPALATNAQAQTVRFYNLGAREGWFKHEVELDENFLNKYIARPYDSLNNPGTDSATLNVAHDLKPVTFKNYVPSNNSYTNIDDSGVRITAKGYLTPIDTTKTKLYYDGLRVTPSSISCDGEKIECNISYSTTLTENKMYKANITVENVLGRAYSTEWSFTYDSTIPDAPIITLDGEFMSNDTAEQAVYTNNANPKLMLNFSALDNEIELTELRIIEEESSYELTGLVNIGNIFETTLNLAGEGLRIVSVNATQKFSEEVSSEQYHEEKAKFYYDITEPQAVSTVTNSDGQGRVFGREAVIRIQAMDNIALSHAEITGDTDSEEEFSLYGSEAATIIARVNVTGDQGTKTLNIITYDMAGNQNETKATFTFVEPLEIIWKYPPYLRTVERNPPIIVETNKDASCTMRFPEGSQALPMTKIGNEHNGVLQALLDFRYGNDANNYIRIECTDTNGYEIKSERFNLVVDNRTPVILQAALTTGYLLSEGNYIITNLDTDFPQIALNISEAANCSYTKTVNDGDPEDPVHIGMGQSLFSGPVEFERVNERQDISLSISCIDLVGYPAVTRELTLLIDSSAFVHILNVAPQGYSNQPDPTLSANTIEMAQCYAEIISPEVEPSFWQTIINTITLNAEGRVAMSRTPDRKSHSIKLSQVAGTAIEGQSYEFKITCDEDDPAIDLFSSEATSTFITDFTPPILTVTNPPYTAQPLEIGPNYIEFRGTTSELSRITFMRGALQAASPIDTSNIFSTTIALNPGLNTINVIATDPAGNTDIETRAIISLGPQPCIYIDGRDGDCVPR